MTFRYSLTTRFNQPYNDQTSLFDSIVPPGTGFQVSIAGRKYLIDTSFEPYRRDAFRHRSIPAQRQAIDFTNQPGEGSVNTADLWRRSMDTWVMGAGQPYIDRKNALPNRFWQSKGITNQLPWQVSLLPKARKIYTSTEITRVIVVGKYMYVADGPTIKVSTNLVTWITITGSPGGTFWAWTTNGYDLWLAFGTHGIYHTTAGSPSMSSYITGTVTNVAWAGVYLLAFGGPHVWQVTSTGTLPATPLFTHPNSQWLWSDACWGDSEIYLSGYVNTGTPSLYQGSNGAVFRTTTQTDGTTLIVPAQALPFEGGEIPITLFSYLNFVFIGTNLGVRMCRTIEAYDPSGNAGDLEAGAIQPNLFMPVKRPVTAITAHNRFIYFAWQTFDTTSSGLGRLDLSNFVDDLTPAYVSALMVGSQAFIRDADWYAPPTANQVLGIVAPFSSPVVAMDSTGLWVYDPQNKVTSGYVDSGYITYGIPDTKVAMALTLRALPPLNGSYRAFVSADQQLSANYSQVGETFTAIPSTLYSLTQIRGEQYQVRVTLSTNGSNGSPVLNRWTLKAYPAVVAGIQVSVVLMLSRMVTEQGVKRSYDPYEEYAFMENLRQSQQVVQYVEGSFVLTVIVTSLDWLPNREQGNRGLWRGYDADLVVYLKSLPTN